MNKIRLAGKLNMIRRYESVIIYGAGGVGRRTARWLSQNKIEGYVYAVSSISRNPKEIEGVKVKQIDELEDLKEKGLVIIATMPEAHKAIEAVLEEKGFSNRMRMDHRWIRALGLVEVNGVYPKKRASYYAWLNQVSGKLFGNFKCKNILIFEAKIDYTENCRALCEYIAETMPGKYKIVWIVRDCRKIKKNPAYVYVSRYQLSSFQIIRLNYYVARAKFLFFTHPSWLHDWKKEQRVINLGHGNPLKKADVPNGHVADCVLASGEDGVKYRKLEYKQDISVEVLGPPRNDWLFEVHPEILKPYIGGRSFQKWIICLPTYKQYDIDLGGIKTLKYDSQEENQYCLNTIDSREELDHLNGFLKEMSIGLICKEHYLQKKTYIKNLSNIVYIDDKMLQRNGHDLYQLLARADAMITDFSSVYMDFLLLDRPVGFFQSTKNAYERGFAVENPEMYMPGKKIFDHQDLLDFIRDVADGNDSFQAERAKARDRIFKYQDDQNCKRCAEYFGL